eukprot:TRINITY_DN4090_c0_g3_i2.p2 TRINITY_DN4090_c0_g3~~TRINITY_DN4090_c0_g3_i2.p2  ORF type:complete len:181 (-),score=55.62 TRINITY_DN4090_c0_g3_i2:79-621(-)
MLRSLVGSEMCIRDRGEGTVVPVTPASQEQHAHSGAGEGRVVTLTDAVTLGDLVDRVKKHLRLAHVRVALAFDRFGEAAVAGAPLDLSGEVRSVGICAGSGSSVLGGVKADVWLTGEMSHHEVLAANAAGTSVVLTDHSNTERGYLPVMADKLAELLRDEGHELPAFMISEVDADPLVVV